MLKKEKTELQSILPKQGKAFFYFANTVKTKAYGSWGEASGWMGLSYQEKLKVLFMTFMFILIY